MKKLVIWLFILFVFAPLQAKIHFSGLSDTLQVELDTKYALFRSVTFTPVVSQDSATIDLLEPMFDAVRLINETDNFQLADTSLLYKQANCTMEQLVKLGNYLSNSLLPSPYGWLLGLQNDDTIVIGIKDTSDTFQAEIGDASVSIKPLSGNILVFSFRIDNGEPTEITLAFNDFLERNIFKTIATEIDGECIMASRLNNTIESGLIEVASMPVSLINKLFLHDNIAPELPEIIEETLIGID